MQTKSNVGEWSREDRTIWTTFEGYIAYIHHTGDIKVADNPIDNIMSLEMLSNNAIFYFLWKRTTATKFTVSHKTIKEWNTLLYIYIYIWSQVSGPLQYKQSEYILRLLKASS